MAIFRAYNRTQRASGHGHTRGEYNQIGNADRVLLRNVLKLAGDLLEAVVHRAIELLSEDERAVTATGIALVKRPRAAIVKHWTSSVQCAASISEERLRTHRLERQPVHRHCTRKWQYLKTTCEAQLPRLPIPAGKCRIAFW